MRMPYFFGLCRAHGQGVGVLVAERTQTHHRTAFGVYRVVFVVAWWAKRSATSPLHQSRPDVPRVVDAAIDLVPSAERGRNWIVSPMPRALIDGEQPGRGQRLIHHLGEDMLFGKRTATDNDGVERAEDEAGDRPGQPADHDDCEPTVATCIPGPAPVSRSQSEEADELVQGYRQQGGEHTANDDDTLIVHLQALEDVVPQGAQATGVARVAVPTTSTIDVRSPR